MSVPIVVVQHMPPMFTRMLAERIDALGLRVRCREAADGETLCPGVVYIAPGGRHLVVDRKGVAGYIAKISDLPPENSCKPAVDVLFRSASQAGGSVLAVVLTGMGQDGLRGCEHLSETGARIIVQDQQSSVVWGMPGAVAQAGLADEVLPLALIPEAIERSLRGCMAESEKGKP